MEDAELRASRAETSTETSGYAGLCALVAPCAPGEPGGRHGTIGFTRGASVALDFAAPALPPRPEAGRADGVARAEAGPRFHFQSESMASVAARVRHETHACLPWSSGNWSPQATRLFPEIKDLSGALRPSPEGATRPGPAAPPADGLVSPPGRSKRPLRCGIEAKARCEPLHASGRITLLAQVVVTEPGSALPRRKGVTAINREPSHRNRGCAQLSTSLHPAQTTLIRPHECSYGN